MIQGQSVFPVPVIYVLMLFEVGLIVGFQECLAIGRLELVNVGVLFLCKSQKMISIQSFACNFIT